jgi:DNA polymerase III epsilon subunit
MREIVFDTETTGLDPYQGHRLIEIGCIELVNRSPTGQTFHHYLNPERDVPAEAFAIHGLSYDFLKSKPLFADIVADLLTFVGDAPLIAHNAAFDLGFLNAELERVKQPFKAWCAARCRVAGGNLPGADRGSPGAARAGHGGGSGRGEGVGRRREDPPGAAAGAPHRGRARRTPRTGS